jgi:hypothetical protein
VAPKKLQENGGGNWFTTKEISTKNVKTCICSFHLKTTYNEHLSLRVAQWVRSLDLTAHTSLSPIRRGFAPRFVNYEKRVRSIRSRKWYSLPVACPRSVVLSEFSGFKTKTGRHDIAEILLKVALITKIQFKFNSSIS